VAPYLPTYHYTQRGNLDAHQRAVLEALPGRHARSLGVTDPRKTFHSFRHLWKDAARAVMPEEHHDAITGHSNGSVGRSYGRGVPLRVLAESMAKINYPAVDRLA
jgi:hypothetical protein